MNTYQTIGILWIVCGVLIPSTPLLVMGIVFLILGTND
jgi:hypothetical protein